MRQFIKHTVAVFALAIISLGQAVAQDVTIIGEGTRTIDPAYRNGINPSIIDTTIPMVVVDYPLLSVKFETTTDLEKIKPVSIKTIDKLSTLYHTYVKLGVGTDLATLGIMPLGEIYFDATRSRKFLYGAHLKHLSNWGDFEDLAPSFYDRTKFNLYGGINEKRYTLRGDVHYNNQGLHYYGISDTLGLSRDSIAQRYSDFGFDFGFASHKKDSSNLNWNVGVGYNNYRSKKPLEMDFSDWRAKENYFGILSGVTYKSGNETYAADFNIRWNGYKYGLVDSSYMNALDTGFVAKNTIVNLKPTITTQLFNDKFRAKVGIDFTINTQAEKTRAHLYPIAELKYSMFNDIFIPYVGLRGGMTQTTFKSLTNENEFLLSNVELRNEHKAIDFYGGFKGTLSKRISFNIGANFAKIKDLALFVTDTTYSLGNKFGVIYDTANVATIEGSMSYQLKEKLKIDGIVRYHSYNLLNNSYAWNKPNLEVLLRGSYNLFDKFLFNVDVNLEQGRKALVYAPGEDVTMENGQYIQALNFIADANLSAEYRYGPRSSFFLQLNNLASQRYQRWYSTPVQSFQVLGGVTFRL